MSRVVGQTPDGKLPTETLKARVRKQLQEIDSFQRAVAEVFPPGVPVARDQVEYEKGRLLWLASDVLELWRRQETGWGQPVDGE